MQPVRNLPQQYREDPWVLALADAILGVLEDQDAQSVSIREQLSLDTITWALEIEEALAGIVPPADATLENRRSTLKAKLRSSGKVTIELIQAVADAWRNGEVEVSFTGIFNTLVVRHQDVAGELSRILNELSVSGVNIANMSLNRDRRGGAALTVVETDQKIPADALERIQALYGVLGATYYEKEED